MQLKYILAVKQRISHAVSGDMRSISRCLVGGFKILDFIFNLDLRDFDYIIGICIFTVNSTSDMIYS